ncbi:MAG: hypothetical protein WC673_01690 [Candidatus Paceibacterota bacterium]|jgi:hypothetical protein
MRNPDPQYIVNLINNFVGQAQIGRLTNYPDKYTSVWSLYPVIGCTIEARLKSSNAETLGRIIEYSDWNVWVGKPRLERKQCMGTVVNDLKTGFPTPLFPLLPNGLCHGLCGRELLERAALVTILMIIVDMIQQEWYKMDRELEADEKEQEHRRQYHRYQAGQDYVA